MGTLSLCICNVSLSLSGAVLATGALMCAGSDSLLCFALALRSLACKYSVQAVQSCDWGLQSTLQSEGRQNCFLGNISKPLSSSLQYKGSTIFGMTCRITCAVNSLGLTPGQTGRLSISLIRSETVTLFSDLRLLV